MSVLNPSQVPIRTISEGVNETLLLIFSRNLVVNQVLKVATLRRSGDDKRL